MSSSQTPKKTPSNKGTPPHSPTAAGGTDSSPYAETQQVSPRRPGSPVQRALLPIRSSASDPGVTTRQSTSLHPQPLYLPTIPPVPTSPAALYTPAFPPTHDSYSGTADSLETVVTRLRNPPQELYSEDRSRVRLTVPWAVGIIGPENFEYSEILGRRVISRNSDIHRHGRARGIPHDVFKWLVGDPAEEEVQLPATAFQEED